MAANEQAIESAGIDVASYTTPGDSHIALGRDLVYTEEVDGVTLVDWIHGLIEGRPSRTFRTITLTDIAIEFLLGVEASGTRKVHGLGSGQGAEVGP